MAGPIASERQPLSFSQEVANNFEQRLNDNKAAFVLYSPMACLAGFGAEYLRHQKHKPSMIAEVGEEVFKRSRHRWQLYTGQKWGLIALAAPWIWNIGASLIETAMSRLSQPNSEQTK